MDSFDIKVVSGIVTVAAVIVVLYAVLASMQSATTGTLEREEIDMCRSLTRESADVLVQVAQSDLDLDNPHNAQRLSAFESRISEIQHNLDELDCHETQDQWAYGSFRQEMSEYEAYIADLVRQNTQK